ncbi:MAG: hypothetical protein ACKVRO_07345 [Micropepsaceae bacterium]
MKHFSAWLALGFGTFLAVAEVLRNGGEIQWWPFWVVDYIAVALLQVGAISVLWTPNDRGVGVLTAAWGFTAAMFYMSLFGHLDEIAKTGVPISLSNIQSATDEPALTLIIGTLFIVTLVGLATSLFADLRRTHEAQ